MVIIIKFGNDAVEFCRWVQTFRTKIPPPFLCFFFYRASLYNLVNKAIWVHNLFLAYMSPSSCFERLWVHHQEKQLCLCDTWYLLFCVDHCLVCRVEQVPGM